MSLKLLNRQQVQQLSRERLAEMREAGIEFVQVLGCNHAPDECESYRAMKGLKVEIAFAPELPLPGCDLEFCKCILIATENNNEL